jgi:hypothetical protein
VFSSFGCIEVPVVLSEMAKTSWPFSLPALDCKGDHYGSAYKADAAELFFTAFDITANFQ